MFLTLTDGEETVLMLLILLAVQTGKSGPEALRECLEGEELEWVEYKIRCFAKKTLRHPVLKLARQEMEELLRSYLERIREERQRRNEREVHDEGIIT